MEKVKLDWDLKDLVESLAKTEEYVNQDQLKVYEYQYGALDLYLKNLEKVKETLRDNILQEFEKRFGHYGYTYTNEDTNGILQRVLQVRRNIDDNKVKKVLNEDQWNLIKKETVNSEKFFDAIKLGVIPANIIQDAVTEQEVDKLVHKENK